MAPAVKGRAAPPEPQPAARLPHTERWQGSDIGIDTIASELTALHVKVARHEAHDDQHPHPRNCVMNLVVVARDSSARDRAIEVAEELAVHHPLRAITVLHKPAHGASRIDAQISTTSGPGLQGSPTQCENVCIDVLGPAGDHLPSLVEPLLVPDVRTYVWWMGSPPLSDQAFLQALDMCEVLIVDSAAFERPFLSILELSQLAEAVGGRIGIADFHWGRLKSWRELLAQFFSPEDRRGFLAGINGVGIDYVGEGRGNRVAAALMAGWLASSLGWKLKQAAANTGGIVVAYFESARSHPVEVAFRSLPHHTLEQGEVSAVRIEASGGGRTCALAVQRDLDEPRRVAVKIEIGGDPFTQVLPMETPNEGDLLLQLLAVGLRDPVYLRSLTSAALLLRAVR